MTSTTPIKTLMRKKKADLQHICRQQGLAFGLQDTKQKLVNHIHPTEEGVREPNTLVRVLITANLRLA